MQAMGFAALRHSERPLWEGRAAAPQMPAGSGGDSETKLAALG